MSPYAVPTTVGVALAAACAATAGAQTAPDRTTLPIPEPKYQPEQVKIITAEIEVPEGKTAHGITIAQNGRFGGWALSVKDGTPAYDYNFPGLQRFTIAATSPVPAGKATIRYEFTYDGGGLGKGGVGNIFVNDKKVAEGRIDQTQAMLFSADEGADVGEDGETPVVETYGMPASYKFTGRIAKITLDLQGMPKADRAEEDRALALAAHKKKLSD